MDAQPSRRPRRKPLCDLTNAPPLSSPAAAYKSKLRQRSSAVTDFSAYSDVPVGSASCNSTAGSTANSNPNSGKVDASSQIGLQISSSSVCDVGNHENDEHSTLNMIQRKDKGMGAEKDNSAISAFSCPPLRKNSTTGSMKQVGGSVPSANPVPFQKKKKRKRRIDSAEHKLPRDFIDEHRAYFEEVDAFELCEEFFFESELE